jgi:hypothetical protein
MRARKPPGCNKQPNLQQPEDAESLERLRRENHILRAELLQAARFGLEPLPEAQAFERFQPRTGSWPPLEKFQVRDDSPEGLPAAPRNQSRNKIRSRSPSPTPSELLAARSRSPSPGVPVSDLGAWAAEGETPYGDARLREDLLAELVRESQRLQKGLRVAAEDFLRQHDELAARILKVSRIGPSSLPPWLPPQPGHRTLNNGGVAGSSQQCRTPTAPHAAHSGRPWPPSPQGPREKADFSARREIAEKQQPKQCVEKSGEVAEDSDKEGDDLADAVLQEEGKVDVVRADVDQCQVGGMIPEVDATQVLYPANLTSTGTIILPLEEEKTMAQKLEDLHMKRARELGPWAVHLLQHLEWFSELRSRETEPEGLMAQLLSSNSRAFVFSLSSQMRGSSPCGRTTR